MFVYEVQIEVDAPLIDSFEQYMIERHIPDLLNTGLFEGAVFSRSENNFSVRYNAIDRSRIDQYIEKASGPLRQDFLDHFPAGVKVSRKIWKVEATFRASDPD